jgi:hypothetical protein
MSSKEGKTYEGKDGRYSDPPEEEADASDAFATCFESMATTLADLFNDGSDETNSFTTAGMEEEMSIFCIVADWWAEENGTWFNEFSDKHCHLWDGENDLHDANDIECKLEWTSLHHEFLSLFEDMIESFIQTQNSTVEKFIIDAEKLMNGVSLTLFEDTGHTDFLNSVFSCLDYKHFHKIMVNAGRRKRFGNGRNRKHKGKSKKEKRLERAKVLQQQASSSSSSAANKK